MRFGEKIKAARLALDLSQAELAQMTGITERSLYSYEQNDTIPRTSNLKKLAQALGVSVSYLMEESESDTQSGINEEIFLANVKNEYGSRGAREASEVLSRASALFAGGELDEEAKEIFFQSLMEVYLDSKAEARSKFAPKSRASRKPKSN
ncbi:MAG: helix-turn-helix transcriptional regulator [Ruminococcaceae bacterium]|nr:helix-turn-helix transcriptional regulator [Oscillospiraceae bacterium]